MRRLQFLQDTLYSEVEDYLDEQGHDSDNIIAEMILDGMTIINRQVYIPMGTIADLVIDTPAGSDTIRINGHEYDIYDTDELVAEGSARYLSAAKIKICE